MTASPPQPTPSHAEVVGPRGARDDALRSCAVLVVDDSRDDRRLLMGLLSRLEVDPPLTVLEAGGFEEGLRLLARVRVGIIFLDHAMPDGNGVDFIVRALSNIDPRRLPIVMLTGQGSEHIAVGAMRRGASDYLSKSELSESVLCRVMLRAQKMRQLAEDLAEMSYAREVAQVAVDARERAVQQLVASIGDYGIVGLDASGHVVSWNLGARRLFDYHDQDIVGAHLRVFGSDSGIAASHSARADLAEAEREGVQRGERYLRRRDGSMFWGRSTLNPTRGDGGQLLGFAWVVHLSSAE